jgi:hypothetical protein
VFLQKLHAIKSATCSWSCAYIVVALCFHTKRKEGQHKRL